MNLINWLLNPKIHANTYFEFFYESTKQYDLFCIFKRLGCVQ